MNELLNENIALGRGVELRELKLRINGDKNIIVIAGHVGIGKTKLMKILYNFYKEKKKCHYIEYMSLFTQELYRQMAPVWKKITGISIPIFGISWNPDAFILGKLEKGEKIVFIENMDRIYIEEIGIILTAASRNNKLKFIIEIDTHKLPDFEKISNPYQICIFEIKELKDDCIRQIVTREKLDIPDNIVEKIVSISEGYPYVAKSLMDIYHNNKEKTSELLDVLIKGEKITNLDAIHRQILGIMGEDTQEIIKSLAIAPSSMTLSLIEAFCDLDKLDRPLMEIIDRKIIVSDKEGFYHIYHPLFRDFLRKIQPISLKNINNIYCKAMEKIKGEYDSIYIIVEIFDESEIYSKLLEKIENFISINNIASVNLMLGKIDRAEYAFTKLFKKAKDSNNISWKLASIANLGTIYWKLGDFAKAKTYHDDALLLFDSISDSKDRKEDRAKLYGNVGNILCEMGELNRDRKKFDEALEYYKKAFKLNEEIKDDSGMSINLVNMGNLYRNMENNDNTCRCYKDALTLSKKSDNKENIALCFANIGATYMVKMDHNYRDKALEYFKKSMIIYTDLGKVEGVAGCLINIGYIFDMSNDFDSALFFYNSSLGLYKTMGMKLGMAKCYGNIGLIHEKMFNYNLYSIMMTNPGHLMHDGNIKMDDLEYAINCYIEGLILYKKMGWKIQTKEFLRSIGVLYKLKGDHENALKYLNEELEISKELNLNAEIIKLMIDIGDIFYMMGEKDKALRYYLDSQEFMIDMDIQMSDNKDIIKYINDINRKIIGILLDY